MTVQAELIEQAVNQPDSHIVGILLNRNYGQHAAIMAGFEAADADLVITLDADLQNPPRRSRVCSQKRMKDSMSSAPCANAVKTRFFAVYLPPSSMEASDGQQGFK
ncbi:glycosyltransferase [Vibrio sp. PP-XX7]